MTKNRQPKEITRDEARYLLMKHLSGLVDYWADEDGRHGIAERNPTVADRLEGLLHSVLVALDGSAMGLPGYMIVPNPHPDDKPYAQRQGYDWEPPVPEKLAERLCDVGGGLHEELFAYRRNEVRRPENLYDFAEFLKDDAKRKGWL